MSPDERGRIVEQARAWLLARARLLLDHRLRGKVDPSDVVQDALVKAVQGLGQLRGVGEAEQRAWLRRILRNTLADLVRQFLQSRKRNVVNSAVRHAERFGAAPRKAWSNQ